MENNINLMEYEFPKLTPIELEFATIPTDMVLLKEAESRGFDDWNNPYHRMFSNLFFNGGSVVFKSNVNPEFKNKCWPYIKCLMGSFAPKHEHKAAVCAMLLSELCELPESK